MQETVRSHRPPRVFAGILFLLAAGYLYGGVILLGVGGSPYYIFAGLAIAASAVFLWRGHKLGSRIYGAMLALTLIWCVAEVGADIWAFLPRIVLPAVVGLWFLTPFARRGVYSPSPPPPLFGSPLSKTVVAVAASAIFIIVLVGTRVSVDALPPRIASTAADAHPIKNWQHYGNTTFGTRYAQLDQITTKNVGNLKEIWRYRTKHSGQFKATPLQVGDLLYVCTAMNFVVALDAETGERRWEFDPENKVAPIGFNTTCRGVSYYHAGDEYQGHCPSRIITGTTDARLIALNAVTGERCSDFGNDGEVSLLPGIGGVRPNVYMVTSPPLIARNLVIVGTRVADNLAVNEPSGVVRAYDAVTGKFVWSWDIGRPGVNTEPSDGEEYTRGTPNVWSMMSFDDKLGLVYLPTGNATPDFFGAHRDQESEKYASSVVALDVASGAVRWSFQTVHHDIWDYDVPSQPSLVDLPQPDGSVVPALVQPTKRGELFMLDRRDGKPIAEVVEKPVPQDPVPEDWVTKTQPFSVGMPNFREELTEARMWGITPFDHMWCRIQFRKLRYEGHFTPPTVSGTLQHPGNTGGFNWGSVAIDEDNKLLVAHPMNMPSVVNLIPRDQANPKIRYQQTGTPYAASIRPFMSPIFVPCLQPPYTRMAVVDLQTRKVVWSKPLGTANEMGPLGMKIGLPIPMGVPAAAGSIVTKGGLIFYGGTMDRYFRAFDVKTGNVLWREYLPAQAQATPISYRAPQSKRQVVVITVPNPQRQMQLAEGASVEDEDPEGGYVIAYALSGV